MSLTEITNTTFGLGTILIQVIIIVLLFIAVFKRNHYVFAFISRHAGLGIFIVSLLATLGSLFYSEIIGYEPCKLCWIQRIFIYPQVVLMITALINRDRRVFDYIIALSSIGGVIGLYNYLLQFGIVPNLSCSAIVGAASCAQRMVFEFGYVTIPMMSLSVFLLTGLLAIVGKISEKSPVQN